MKILSSRKEDIKIAANLLKEGKLVAFPTETVYGVGCIYGNDTAFTSLNKLKRRDPDKPYTLMVDSIDKIKEYAIFDKKIELFLKKILPGSVTVLLRVKENIYEHAYKDGVIGFRIPTNKEALSLLKEVNYPLFVPSLNRSGDAPKKDINDIKNEFNNELAALIEGEISENIPSTVISLVNGIHLLREGKVKFNELERLFNSL